jgi:hypothetical protein
MDVVSCGDFVGPWRLLHPLLVIGTKQGGVRLQVLCFALGLNHPSHIRNLEAILPEIKMGKIAHVYQTTYL